MTQEFDITEAVATYSIKDLIKLFILLDQNDFTHIYFDGYDASLTALKTKKEK